jgi:rhamnosyltransferase
MAADLVPEAEYLVYLTQDAIPYDEHSLANLLQSFDDPRVGAAYGRQLARPQADAIERHGRLFNYPDISARRDFASRTSLGFRSAYFSNSFAAYRRSAFEDVCGFPGHVIVSEDVSAAARMLLKGWSIAYCSEAKVTHSHDLSIRSEFSRYFDISIHHQQESWIIEQFGSVGGEGLKFVLSELRYLANNSPQLIPKALLRSAVKWTAYQCGRRESMLPRWLKRNLSSHPTYWTGEDSFITAQRAIRHANMTTSAVTFHPSPGPGPVIQ